MMSNDGTYSRARHHTAVCIVEGCGRNYITFMSHVPFCPVCWRSIPQVYKDEFVDYLKSNAYDSNNPRHKELARLLSFKIDRKSFKEKVTKNRATTRIKIAYDAQ